MLTEAAHFSFEKIKPYRNRAYRMAVASLACVHCGIDGYSQCAHANGHLFSKGLGLKADDRDSFPLCCTRVGIPGCHWLFDHHQLLPADEVEAEVRRWISWTRAAVANGRG